MVNIHSGAYEFLIEFCCVSTFVQQALCHARFAWGGGREKVTLRDWLWGFGRKRSRLSTGMVGLEKGTLHCMILQPNLRREMWLTRDLV